MEEQRPSFCIRLTFEDLAILTHPVGRRSLSVCGLSPLPRDTCSVSAVENEGRNFAMAPELEWERFSLSLSRYRDGLKRGPKFEVEKLHDRI